MVWKKVWSEGHEMVSIVVSNRFGKGLERVSEAINGLATTTSIGESGMQLWWKCDSLIAIIVCVPNT